MKRALGVAAVLLGVVAMSVGSAGLAAAQGSGGNGKSTGSPPGNNGTVKIDQSVLSPVGKVDHDNDPHVSCSFTLNFFGFDATQNQAVVNFFAQPPSGNFQPVDPTVGPSNPFSFTGHGPGNTLDASVLYQLDVTGLKANVNQGYHIKVDVEVTDQSLPNGSDDKYKVFWVAPCSTTPEHETTTTTPSTTTTSTIPPSTTSVPEESTTTTPSSTTSTTLQPTPGSVPVESTSTTTPSSTTTTPTSIPPITSSGSGGQTATTSTTRPPTTHPAATGSAPGTPQSPSGLAFTNGPTPSGAGTDIGFFSPSSSSVLPWLLIIVGGVLLSGAGTLTLTGTFAGALSRSRIRKWISRA